MILKSGRLILRPVRPEDHAGLHALFTQPGVRRFVFDDEIISSEQTTEIIRTSVELFRTQQFGLWLAERRGDVLAAADFVGWGGCGTSATRPNSSFASTSFSHVQCVFVGPWRAQGEAVRVARDARPVAAPCTACPPRGAQPVPAHRLSPAYRTPDATLNLPWRAPMLIFTLLFITLFIPAVANAQPTPPGFSTYLVGMMTRGEANSDAGPSAGELQKAHLANLNAMWEEGLLLASGPIGDTGPLRGLLVFTASDRARIEQRIAADPLVKAGRLRVGLTRWMGPSDMGAGYRNWAADNPGKPDPMRTYQLVLMRVAPKALPMTPDEQRAHLMHMDAMVKAGHLVTAGPMLEPGELAGLFVFATDAAEADRLAASDPAVKSGKMVVERHPWLVAEGVLPKTFKVPVP
jgi:uncharacterized protein YciI